MILRCYGKVINSLADELDKLKELLVKSCVRDILERHDKTFDLIDWSNEVGLYDVIREHERSFSLDLGEIQRMIELELERVDKQPNEG